MADVEFTAQLTDQFSGPAGKIADGLEEIGQEATKAGEGVADAGKGVDALGSAAKGGAGSAGLMQGAVAGLAASAGLAAVDIGKELVGAIKDLAAELGSAIVEAAEFNRSTKALFAVLSRGATDGSEDVKNLREVFAATGKDLDHLKEQYTRLRAAGFTSEQAKVFSEIGENIQAVTGEGDIFIDKLRDAKKELTLSGKISDTVFEDMAEQLGGTEKLAAALGKQMGKSAEEVKALFKAGEFKDFDALLAASKELGGELKGAAKGSQTLGEQLKSLATVTLLDITEGLDLKATFAPLLDELGPLLKEITPIAKEFLSGFSEGFGDSLKEIVAGFKELAKALGLSNAEDFKGTARDIGKLLGQILPYVIALVGAFIVFVGVMTAVAATGAAVVGALIALPALIGGLVTSVLGAGAELGANIISGLVSGIRNGLSLVVDAIKSVASSAVKAAKGALGIASPSKVFEGLGGYTAEGMQIGIERGSPGVQKAAQGMVQPRALKGAGGAAGGGVSVTMHVNGTADPGETARLAVDLLTSRLETMALEVGA